MRHRTKSLVSALVFAFGMAASPTIGAAGDVEAAREAADYHMMFLVEHVVQPFRLPADALLTCTFEGQPVTIFRGDSRVRSGLPTSVDVPCWPSAERQPEPPGSTRYYYEDPDNPSTLILWANWNGDRLVGFDWVELN